MSLTTKRVVLIGTPIARSLSPAFQNAAFRAAGIDAHYGLAEITPDALPATIAALRGADWLGANVTIPYKEAVLPLMDTASDEARAVGAVNTVINRNGTLHGANSDVPGFAAALREAGVDVAGQTAFMLGAGGSARAVAVALRQMGAARLVIANRTTTRAEAIAALWPYGNATAIALDSTLMHDTLPSAALVVNTIPVGLYSDASPLTTDALTLLPTAATVYDLVYGHTPLIHAAEARGLRALDGLSMLIHQGAVSWEMWTGQPAPLAAMWAAVKL